MIRLAAIAVALALAAACVSDDEESLPSATPDASETATTTATVPTGPVQLVIDEPLPVYMVPVTASLSIGELPGGTTVTVIARDASWLALEGYGWVWPPRTIRDLPELADVPWGAIPLSFAAHADPPETGVEVVDRAIRAVLIGDEAALGGEFLLPDAAGFGGWRLFAVVQRELPDYEIAWEIIFQDEAGAAFSLIVDAGGVASLVEGEPARGMSAATRLTIQSGVELFLVAPPRPSGLDPPDAPAARFPVIAEAMSEAVPVYWADSSGRRNTSR